jgi:uncharacterized membrane protein YphA (DoxX/SURF4 family)
LPPTIVIGLPNDDARRVHQDWKSRGLVAAPPWATGQRGAGRFAKIGIPAPEVMGPFIGFIEIACGALVLAGLVTRVAALLLLADMTVAILSTKLPILIGHGYWRFAAPSGVKAGLWTMLHEARTDLSMWLSCLFLLAVGAGPRSADARLSGGRPRRSD